MSRYKYNGKANQEIIDKANRISKMSLEKIKMLDIEVIFEASNGVRVLRFPADGLVDEDRDWKFIDIESVDSEIYTYRISGLPEEVEDKEYIESINFRACVEYPYELFELTRTSECLDVTDEKYEIVGNNITGRGLGFNYEAIIINRDGDIIVNTLLKDRNEIQFKNTRDYFEKIGQAREKLAKQIMKQGPCENVVSKNKEYGYTYNKDELCYIDVVEFGEYQIALMGSGIESTFVLFDKANSECIAYGINTTMKVHYISDVPYKLTGKIVGIAECGFIAIDTKRGRVLIDKRDVPKNKYLDENGFESNRDKLLTRNMCNILVERLKHV